MSVNEVLEVIPTLSLEERARVKALIDSLSDELTHSEDRARQALMRAGLLRRRQPRSPRSAPSASTPVEIKGSPLSETIIEERR